MKKSAKIKRSLASILSAAMLFSSVFGNAGLTPVSADDSVTTFEEWELSKDDEGVNVARWSGSDFYFHSASDFDYNTTSDTFDGESKTFNYVRTTGTNGKQASGIVQTSGAYCDYEAKSSGVLSVYIKIASGKAFYVSKTDEDDESSEVGHFTIGTESTYDDYEDIAVTPSDTNKTIKIDIDCESGNTYYMAVIGSKAWIYGIEEDMANTTLSGEITGKVEDLPEDYSINFIDEDEVKHEATRSDNSYSIVLRPGDYTASLKGAKGYAIAKDSKKVTVGTDSEQNHNIEIVESESFTMSGAIKGVSEDYDLSDLKLTFTPSDTASNDPVNAEIDTENRSYSAELVSGEKYSLSMSGAEDYKLSEEVTAELSADTEKDIKLALKDVYTVSGGFIGLTDVRGEYENLSVAPTSISFKNVDDEYEYSGDITDNGYKVSLRPGSYLASIESDEYSTSTHVVVEDSDLSRDLLLKAEKTEAVEYSAEIEVGEDKEYKSLRAAVEAVKNMTRESDERVTIVLDPGTYREQVYIDTPNVTLKSASGDRDDTTISWYYGIGYKYYSVVNSLYDPYADYDQFEKGNVTSYWGSAVITTANAEGFRAENITFENSFNKYMTEEELSDGVEVDGLESITVVRRAATDVKTKTATERAAAYVNYADQTEFNNCAFIGSQDTLYTCNRQLDAYYRNCYIEGQTDFIYGNGDVIFDGCEINFCGYTDKAAAGYLTANSCSKSYYADNGYIFRSCYISYADDSDMLTTPGYFGRTWGDSAKVRFINTRLQDKDMILADGWSSMSKVNPTDETVSLLEYNTTFAGEAVSTSGRVTGVIDSIDADDYSVENVFTKNGWTPSYYTGDAYSTPKFSVEPTLTSNGDLNAPNPGEKVTVMYELGNDWADEDASIISWYAVDTDYDNSSLENTLKSAELISTSVASVTNSVQIPMSAAGKYLMVVVTAAVNDGSVGATEYIVNEGLAAISSTWSDPSNPDSISPGSGINIYLAGDSTVKDYSPKGIYNNGSNDPRASWGEYLQDFLNDDYVTVNNYAQGGRSSRSFINEGKLDAILENIGEGDYLFVQFGHNDEGNQQSYYIDRFAPLWVKGTGTIYSNFPTIKPEESMMTATPSSLTSAISNSKYYAWDCGATFKGYLQYYVDEALAKGATPVIVTPVSRMYYGTDGKIYDHHDATGTDYADTAEYGIAKEYRCDTYVTACKEVYEANKDKGVLLVDAYAATREMFDDAYAACGSDANGQAIMNASDKTHSNKVGGFIQAAVFAEWIQDAGLDISKYVEKPASVYGDDNTDQYIFELNADSEFKAYDNKHNYQEYWTEVGQKLINEVAEKHDQINASEDTEDKDTRSEDSEKTDEDKTSTDEDKKTDEDKTAADEDKTATDEDKTSADEDKTDADEDKTVSDDDAADEDKTVSDDEAVSDDDADSDLDDSVSDDNAAVSVNEAEAAKAANKPYGEVTKTLEVNGMSVSVNYCENIPYMGVSVKNAEDIGLSLTVDGKEIPASALRIKVKGKKGAGNPFTVQLKGFKGAYNTADYKKVKASLKKLEIGGTQYAMTVKKAIASKLSASESGQVMVKLNKSGSGVQNAKLVIIYHDAKGASKRKLVKINKADIAGYDAATKTVTFSGNLNGSATIK